MSTDNTRPNLKPLKPEDHSNPAFKAVHDYVHGSFQPIYFGQTNYSEGISADGEIVSELLGGNLDKVTELIHESFQHAEFEGTADTAREIQAKHPDLDTEDIMEALYELTDQDIVDDNFAAHGWQEHVELVVPVDGIELGDYSTWTERDAAASRLAGMGIAQEQIDELLDNSFHSEGQKNMLMLSFSMSVKELYDLVKAGDTAEVNIKNAEIWSGNPLQGDGHQVSTNYNLSMSGADLLKRNIGDDVYTYVADVVGDPVKGWYRHGDQEVSVTAIPAPSVEL